MSVVSSSPALANGLVYVGCADSNLYALNAIDGQLVWKYTTGGEVASSPAITNNAVIFGSCDGKVYALDALTGAFMWSYATGGKVVSSPSIANGIVYVGSYDHMVYAFGILQGQPANAEPWPNWQIISVFAVVVLVAVTVLILLHVIRKPQGSIDFHVKT